MLQAVHGPTVPDQGSRPSLFAPEAPDDGPRLLLYGAIKIARAGETLYADEDAADFVYQVVSGVARTVAFRRDGRRVVYGFHLPGEIFGLERERLHHGSAEAVSDLRVVLCPHRALEDLAPLDPEAARELQSWMLRSRDRADERIRYLIHGSAFEKLSHFLLDLSRRTRSQGRIDLPMSRYDIADYLGLSSETVSRTFTVFRDRHIILTHDRQVTLLDSRRLHTGDDDLPGFQDIDD